MTRAPRSLAAALLIMTALAGCSHSSAGSGTAPLTAAAATTAPAADPPASGTAAPPQAAAARTSVLMVLDDFERDGEAVKLGKPKRDRGDDQTGYYADHTAMAAIHGGGGAGAPLSCGKAGGKTVIDGAIIGTPAVGADGTVIVPVALYTGPDPAANLSVTADAAGKLVRISCAPPTAPTLPGATTLAAYYGGWAAAATDPAADAKTAALKDRYVAPAFAAFTRTDVDADQSTCAEDTMSYWHAVYDPGATTTGAQWYFNPGGPGQVEMSVAVDAAAAHIAWVYCFGQLTPPLAPGGAYSDSQIQSFVSDLFNDYAYLHALAPFGADASGMRAYFASDAAYRAAVAGTGAQPLECSATAATSIGADDVDVATAGSTDVVSLASSPSGHPVTSGALGHPKVTVDTGTLKITAVTCG